MAKKTYTLYLAKSSHETFEELLTEAAQDKLSNAGTQVVSSNDFGDGARLFVFTGNSFTPKWMTELQTDFDFRETRTNSSCAVLMFWSTDRLFAATFAHAWMYLDESRIEADFGLKVSLNALDESRLRRLERANLGDALREVSLSPFQRDFISFGIDDALDLVRKISGSTRDGTQAEVMTGARSLRLSGDFSLTHLPELAGEALAFFESDAYRNSNFRIIDHVRPVSDPTLIGQLDNIAADSIRQGQPNFELGLPATLEDEGVGYKFRGPGLRGHYSDLILRNYMSVLGDRLNQLTSQTLETHRIAAVFEDGVRPERSWSIRSALVGSVVHEGNRYAINEGEWYQVEEQFRRSIETSFASLVEDWNGDLPSPLARIYDDQRNATFETEAQYNVNLCEERVYILMDQRLIAIPGNQLARFEACDALDIAGKRFIHVKRSSRRSSVLSHFFKQGSNSAQQFRRFAGAWEALGEVVEQHYGAQVRAQLLAANENQQRKWGVEYWIIDVPRASGEFNIPFFSKISLRDEMTNLHIMNYEVCVRFIRIEPEHV